MSSPTSTEQSENTCVVCFKNVEIYSIGECDHPVCYECSTRMRVICVRNECPICRQDMPKVIFTKKVRPFKQIANWQYLFEDRYKICFDSNHIQNQYEKLLEHRCPKCKEKVFLNFQKLGDHMMREHELFFCELCVDNLKIFTFERRVYTRADLARHRRIGDVDDRSHKGHPKCHYCDCRFMDTDELFRHSRRDHHYCHVCDADGLHQFYSCYRELRDHFRKEHFLCEEGDCIIEEFTTVFSSEIDLKAHKASSHMSGMTKAASKQARTLELEFTLAPRSRERPDRGHRSATAEHQQNAERAYHHHGDEELGAVGGVDPRQGRKPQLNLNDFPTLGAEGPAAVPGPMMQRSGGRRGFTISTVSRGGPPPINDSDYPALGPVSDQPGHSKTVRVSVNSKNQPAVSIQVSRPGRPTGPPASQPQQSANAANQPPKRPGRPTSSAFDGDFYPPLTPLSAYQGTSSTEWVSTSSKTERGKTQAQSKVQLINASTVAHMTTSSNLPPPQSQPQTPVQSARFYERNFPSLGPSKPASQPTSQPTKWKASSSVSIPMSSGWTNNANNATAAQSSDNETSSAVSGIAAKSKKKKKKGGKGAEPSKMSNGTENASASAFPDTNETTSKKNQSNDNQASMSLKGDKEKSTGVPKGAKSKDTASNGERAPKPTQERKRSELEIADLHLYDDAQSPPETMEREREPPPTDRLLSLIRGDPAPPKPGPPGFERAAVPPPPGFQQPPVSSVPGPPPGFEVNVKSIARPLSNGLTFTNSSGESYPITALPSNQYAQPPEFHSRNAALKALVEEALSQSDSGNRKSDFQEMSILYRQGYVPVEVYYEYCKTSMGDGPFAEIFPEMICLLPDIEKQQELHAVHVNSSGVSNWTSDKEGLEVCASCGQVLQLSDVSAHMTTHALNTQFPALPGETSVPAASGAWSRK